MTTFMYENQEVLNELSKKYFEKGELPSVKSVEQLMVCKYILSYRYIMGATIVDTSILALRNAALTLQYSKHNLVFFEKLTDGTNDFIFFMEYAKRVEKKQQFKEAWGSNVA